MTRKIILWSVFIFSFGINWSWNSSFSQTTSNSQPIFYSPIYHPHNSQYNHDSREFVETVQSFETEYNILLDSLNLVGVSVALVKDNEIVYTGQFGFKNLNTLEPITEKTLFRVASISKSFTVTALIHLYEQGLVDIQEDINNYLPFELRNPKYPEVPITIEMLMSHLSSINDSQGYSISFDPINPSLSGEKVALCYNDYAPGTGYSYSNYNTNILACVIENVTGQPWFDYIEETILKPLEIEGGYNVDKLDRESFATLYKWEEAEYIPQPEAYKRPTVLDNYHLQVDSPRLSAAGGMKINAKDLARYMLMHMHYGLSPNSEERIISEESSRRMQTVLTDSVEFAPNGFARMGLGLFRSNTNTPGVELVGHDGGAYGLKSAMFFNPEEKYGFVMICNGTTINSVTKKTLSMMYEHFIGPLP